MLGMILKANVYYIPGISCFESYMDEYESYVSLLGPRCEQTLFNAPGEALALTDAARLFLSSEKENRALQAPGFDEHLQAALNCYSFAIKVRTPFTHTARSHY